MANKKYRDSAFARKLGEGVLTRVVHLLLKLGIQPQSIQAAVDAVTDPKANRAVSVSSLAQRIFFEYPEILKEWHTNPRFTDASGNPAKLPIHGRGRSFDSLVRQIESNSDPAEALGVLLETRAIVRVGRSSVRARSRVLNTAASNGLTAVRLSCVVDAMLTTVERNFEVRARERTRKGFYERAATSRSVDARYLSEFQLFLWEQGDEFMQTVDDWLSAHSVSGRDARKRIKTLRVGTGVYMFAGN